MIDPDLFYLAGRAMAEQEERARQAEILRTEAQRSVATRVTHRNQEALREYYRAQYGGAIRGLEAEQYIVDEPRVGTERLFDQIRPDTDVRGQIPGATAAYVQRNAYLRTSVLIARCRCRRYHRIEFGDDQTGDDAFTAILGTMATRIRECTSCRR